jgi:hypothetical protein
LGKRLIGYAESYLKPLFDQVKSLEVIFSAISYAHIFRKLNMEADVQYKKALELAKGKWEIDEEDAGSALPFSLRPLYTV